MVVGLSMSLVLSGISPAVAQETGELSLPNGSANTQADDKQTESSDQKGTSLSGGAEAASSVGSLDDATKQSDDLSSKPVGSTDVRTVFGAVVGALAVGGLIAAGINWAVQARILPNPFAPAQKAPAPKPVAAPA